jgi:hypothetical protein
MLNLAPLALEATEIEQLSLLKEVELSSRSVVLVLSFDGTSYNRCNLY